MKYTIRWDPVILLACLVLANCGGAAPPNTVPRTPVAQVAVEATAVLKAADAVLTGLDRAMDPAANPRLPVAIGLPIVKAIREVGVQGQNLAVTLTVVKSAATVADQNAGAARARQTLVAIRGLLSSALSPIRDPAMKDQVTQLLAGLVEALDKAQQIVDVVRQDAAAWCRQGPNLPLVPCDGPKGWTHGR